MMPTLLRRGLQGGLSLVSRSALPLDSTKAHFIAPLFRIPDGLGWRTMAGPSGPATSATSIPRASSPVTSLKTITLEAAKEMPKSYSEMSNETLLAFAAAEDHGAIRERLIRTIMVEDNCQWELAETVVMKMDRVNKKWRKFEIAPYYLGFTAAVTAGLASIPLCFHEATVLAFNTHFVTTDVPPPEDLETWLEVGSWAWGWMEPPLGQLSFLLLCFAYARNQLVNLKITPYTSYVKGLRAERLKTAFPRYNAQIVASFAETAEW